MLKDYVVLFILKDNPLMVEGFLCSAEDSDHAEEQAMDAYPDCEVVWIEEGTNWEKAHDNYLEAYLTP